jgi:polysaccharide pyruvyl transferase WcaK-like protein
MRIILDNGAYSLRNMGDVAMLQMSVRRLREMVKEPELLILTTAPEMLQRYCPGTSALSVSSRDCAYQSKCPARSEWSETWNRWMRRWRPVSDEAREFERALEGADAVFVGGGGFLNDINPYQTRPLLRMIIDSARRGKKTALFSQGLGPLTDPELTALLRLACAAGVPSGLRESLYGPEILSRARAKPSQYAITGDDAVEMAWERGAAVDGKALGFSVRQVAYSEIESSHLQTVAWALQHLRERLGTTIVPLPISFNPHERDDEVIGKVTGAAGMRNGMDTPQALIASVAECRVLVTGTYHAAVFALARGIPCVCFYASVYYGNKLTGLAGQFPGGCRVVDMASSQAGEQLVRNAIELWEMTGRDLGARLRQSAQTQVESARGFYQRVTA